MISYRPVVSTIPVSNGRCAVAHSISRLYSSSPASGGVTLLEFDALRIDGKLKSRGYLHANASPLVISKPNSEVTTES